MAKLEGQTIAASFDQVLIVDHADGINADLQAIESADTDGNSSCLKIATTKAGIIGSGYKLYFGDEGDEHISGNTSVLSIAAGAEIDLTATAVDLNGTLDVSGALTVGGNIDFNSGTIDTSTQTVTV
ncbi:MAG: hypothetical protein QF535_24100, partial [Anaerolineales bacterium]|nr:hypothetical protein [Anaerolineales bacterium]